MRLTLQCVGQTTKQSESAVLGPRAQPIVGQCLGKGRPRDGPPTGSVLDTYHLPKHSIQRTVHLQLYSLKGSMQGKKIFCVQKYLKLSIYSQNCRYLFPCLLLFHAVLEMITDII